MVLRCAFAVNFVVCDSLFDCSFVSVMAFVQLVDGARAGASEDGL
jgi:hypothetical protein